MDLQERPDGTYRVVIAEMDVFTVYAASGGLYSRAVGYLVRRGEGLPPNSVTCSDLGLPVSSEALKIFEHERGWKHAAVWIDLPGSPDPPQIDAAAKVLLDA